MAQLSSVCGSMKRNVLLAMVFPALTALGPGCASGAQEDTGTGPPRDAGADVRLDATSDAPTDTPPTDAPRDTAPVTDGGGGCGGGAACTGLTHCVDGSCVDYPPCRGDSTCPTPGDVCLTRRCIPGTDDPDLDGSPASEDCDETDPTRNPRLPEICNDRDDNCNGARDEGDPAQVCDNGDQPGLCMSGACSCPAGSYDFDRAILGCECVATPAVSDGVACTSPIDLGDFPDSGSTMVITGNAFPTGREVWYSFNAVDTPDTTCDNFHVRVRFTDTGNPAAAYDLAVFRGSCDTVTCEEPGVSTMTDYSWATDFAPATVPGSTGECPCSAANDSALVPGNIAAPGVNFCNDNTARYNVRIRRVSGAPDTCDGFGVEITNGVFDT